MRLLVLTKEMEHSDPCCSSPCLVPSYRVGLDVSIALEFRTSRTSGVLLAISNQASDGLGLELVQGNVRKQ